MNSKNSFFKRSSDSDNEENQNQQEDQVIEQYIPQKKESRAEQSDNDGYEESPDSDRRSSPDDQPYSDRRSSERASRYSESRNVRSSESQDSESDRPRDDRGDRPYGDRSDRPRSDRGDKPYGDRSDRPRSDRGDKPYGDRSDRPRDDRGDRPYGDRSDRPREDRSDRPYGDRSDRPRDDRGDKPYGDRSDRPRSDRGDKPYGDRSDRPRDDRPYGDRSDRPRSDRGDRPYGDRSDRPRGDRPYGDRSNKPRGERTDYRKDENKKPRESEDREAPENVIYGIHPVCEAIEMGRSIEKIYFRRQSQSDDARYEYGRSPNYDALDKIKGMIAGSDIVGQDVPPEKLDRLSRRGNHQGVVAVLPAIDYVEFNDLLDKVTGADVPPLIVAMDSVTDVRNFGAIARSAEGAGADAIIMSAKNSAPVNSEAMRSSAGALSIIPVCRVGSLRNSLKSLQMAGLQLVAATENGGNISFEADFTKPTVIVMGSEDRGISSEILKMCDTQVSIPLLGKIESLNVSAAASVLLFEAVRQRFMAIEE